MWYNETKVVIQLKKFSKIFAAVLCGVLSFNLISCGINPKEIHGEELLRLSDGELYEKVYLQTLDLVESYPDEEAALAKMSRERRTFYILSIFDMEIQNGGLCQFFVNPSRLLAPRVEECLETVNAVEHKNLFSSFVADNNIDLNHLESFDIEDVNDYIAQTKRYDFNSFDDAYVELTPLQDYMVLYIKANISEF
jgi:hypothetical protein